MKIQNVPVNTPLLDGNELKYLTECIETGWISSEGPFIKMFEDKMASYVNRNYGIAVSNGSAALDIAIRALDLELGSEVIMPTFTIISPAQSLINSGLVPVLVDCEEDTWNMDTKQIEQKITKKTKAILVVHIYGLPVDMKSILNLCKKYNLKLIEDAAEMHGQKYDDAQCGSFGDISIFSFYPNKHITSGEGGMIMCNDLLLAERSRKLRNLAFEPNGRRFVHEEIGWNYRMTNIQAAIGLAQLEKINEHVIKKRQVGEKYYNELKDLAGFKLQKPNTENSTNIYWVFGLVAESEKLAKDMVDFLTENKIGTRPFFWCMHEQPVFKRMNLFLNDKHPVAENIARCGFYIPSGLGLTEDETNYVIETIKKFA
jgi:perosamine synthetase